VVRLLFSLCGALIALFIDNLSLNASSHKSTAKSKHKNFTVFENGALGHMEERH